MIVKANSKKRLCEIQSQISMNCASVEGSSNSLAQKVVEIALPVANLPNFVENTMNISSDDTREQQTRVVLTEPTVPRNLVRIVNSVAIDV